ncbi:MAG: hypothetical protein FJ406_07890 [Verrucomicrobia bacterium]|nr:hypothetical protein [Verrucomicrobiota bacterium]MBM3871684.1 hypothetical protein [Verrucomicrobiota bacterium]
MAIKSEVGWTRKGEDGVKYEISCRRYGGEWLFFQQFKRGEDWELVKNPLLEDWLELLDTVRRRINRRLLRPEEEISVKKMIYDRFPGTKLD